MCLIPANSDVAGIGVRSSVYIQAFLSIISAILRQAIIKYTDDLEKHEKRMADSAIILLVTGIALVVSGVIQATLYGLTVYHALIVLALSWLTVLAAIPPYIIIASKIFERVGGEDTFQPSHFRDFIKEPRKRSLIVLHSLHLSFTAAFGIWIFTRIQTFDTSPPPVCTPSTVLEFLGHTWSVLSPSFRRMGLALYGTVLLPPLNLIIITAAFGLASLVLVFSLGASCCFSGNEWAAVRTITALSNGIPPLLVAVLIVVSVEKTIDANAVAPGQDQWTIGQTLALFVSLIPLFDLVHWLYEEAKPSQRVRPDACTHSCHEHSPTGASSSRAGAASPHGDSTGRTEADLGTLGALWYPTFPIIGDICQAELCTCCCVLLCSPC